MELCAADLVLFLPIVPASMKTEWEDYAIQNQDWIHQGLYLNGQGDVDPGKIPEAIYSTTNETWSGDIDFNFHAPLWQMAPAPTNAKVVMQDMLEYEWFTKAAMEAIEVHHESMSGFVNLDFLLRFADETGARHVSPRSVILHPVSKTFPAGEEDGETVREREEVGFIMAAISWKAYFSNLLPEGKNGFLVEVNDNCGSVFTYRIDGHNAEYRGGESHYDQKYKDLHQKSDFAAFYTYDGNDTLEANIANTPSTFIPQMNLSHSTRPMNQSCTPLVLSLYSCLQQWFSLCTTWPYSVDNSRCCQLQSVQQKSWSRYSRRTFRNE
jgi:hypothetical protein